MASLTLVRGRTMLSQEKWARILPLYVMEEYSWLDDYRFALKQPAMSVG